MSDLNAQLKDAITAAERAVAAIGKIVSDDEAAAQQRITQENGTFLERLQNMLDFNGSLGAKFVNHLDHLIVGGVFMTSFFSFCIDKNVRFKLVGASQHDCILCGQLLGRLLKYVSADDWSAFLDLVFEDETDFYSIVRSSDQLKDVRCNVRGKDHRIVSLHFDSEAREYRLCARARKGIDLNATYELIVPLDKQKADAMYVVMLRRLETIATEAAEQSIRVASFCTMSDVSIASLEKSDSQLSVLDHE